MPSGDLDPDREDVVDEAWEKEIQQRYEDLKTGRVKGLSLNEAMRIIMDDENEPDGPERKVVHAD